jgi:DNA modification methylase
MLPEGNYTSPTGDVLLYFGECRRRLRTFPAGFFDAVVTDPPYAEIDRPYGRLTERQWHGLMDDVCNETRRVLKPRGSAVFIIQANMEVVGKTRLWPFEFIVRWGKAWGLIQDAYWWNYQAIPAAGVRDGLLKTSVKTCVWLGPPDCYRNQAAVLRTQDKGIEAAGRVYSGVTRRKPSGHSTNDARMAATVAARGGAAPFNMLPVPNGQSHKDTAGGRGHGAGTPAALCEFWCRYLCPPGGWILDPFSGSGSVPVAALRCEMKAVGIEQMPAYHAVACDRVRLAAEELAEG